MIYITRSIPRIDASILLQGLKRKPLKEIHIITRSKKPEYLGSTFRNSIRCLHNTHIKSNFSKTNEGDILISDKFMDILKSYKAPKYPIVLCHGFLGTDFFKILPSPTFIPLPKSLQLPYWRGVEDALRDHGATIITAKVPPLGSIENRAGILSEHIAKSIEKLKGKKVHDVYNVNHKEEANDIPNSENGPTSKIEKEDIVKVNLIAHSMGGLDCRYLISNLKPKNVEIASLTTIGTPHRGSPMADYVYDILKKTGVPENAIPEGLKELTTSSMKIFNEKVLDREGIQYFSYGSKFVPNWYNVFKISWNVVYGIEGDNDGMVSVTSSKWGKYLGTLDNVDHLDLINWTNVIKLQYSRFTGQKPKFDAVAFYLDIANNLERRGF